MKIVERILNLFILFMLNIGGLLYEFHLNQVPYTYIFDPLALLVPVVLTVEIGVLGEVLLYIKQN